jgi:hypothetical protein
MNKQVDPISLECRDMRHAWSQKNDIVLSEKRGIVRIFTRNLICIRCGTERSDTYEVVRSQVALLHTKYKYPDGYHVNGGLSVSSARSLLWSTLIQNGRA